MKRLTADLISSCIIFFVVGVFVGVILTMVYVKDVFEKEYTVSVTPRGYSYHPYTNIRQMGVIDRQEFKIFFRNGIQISDEWLKYSYE